MRVLIAEDDPLFRQILERILTNWGYEVIVACDGNEAWEILRSENAPLLAILDWMIPGIDGVEICRRVRSELQEPYIYLVLLTGQHRGEDLVTGMEAGADDYITKPLNQGELNVRLRAGRRIVELQNQLLETQRILRDKASHDSLSGLWNHEEILKILRRELARRKREGECISVIMVDIDHFKSINDTYGHMVGDEVIRLVVRRMQSMVRSYDFVGRYGGEEFLFVLPACCRHCSVAFAERLRQAICGEEMVTTVGKIPLTISLGLATVNRNSKWDVGSLVRAADAALYLAKEKGRNRVEIA